MVTKRIANQGIFNENLRRSFEKLVADKKDHANHDANLRLKLFRNQPTLQVFVVDNEQLIVNREMHFTGFNTYFIGQKIQRRGHSVCQQFIRIRTRLAQYKYQ